MPRRLIKRKVRANGEGTIYQRLITRKDGSSYTRWEAKLTVAILDGQRKRKTLYGKTQAEAREKLAQLRSKLSSGIGIETPLLKDFAEEWLNEKALRVKQNTLNDYTYETCKFIIPYLGHLKLNDITPKRVQAFQSQLAATHNPKRANRVTSRLAMLMNSATALELVHRNPCTPISSLRTETTEMVIWNMDEARKFLELAKNSPLYDLYYLIMSTGLRRGEALGLRWKDIQGHFISIRQNLVETGGRISFSTPKTKSSLRTIDIPDDVLAVLEPRKKVAKTELIFTTSEDTPFSPRNVLRDFEQTQNGVRLKWLEQLELLVETPELSQLKTKLHEKAVLPHARIHDLRHYYASLLILILKKTPLEVAARLGHTNPSFTMNKYGHLFDEQRTLLKDAKKNTAPSLLDFLGKVA